MPVPQAFSIESMDVALVGDEADIRAYCFHSTVELQVGQRGYWKSPLEPFLDTVLRKSVSGKPFHPVPVELLAGMHFLVTISRPYRKKVKGALDITVILEGLLLRPGYPGA